jgi:hypothetical protein
MSLFNSLYAIQIKNSGFVSSALTNVFCPTPPLPGAGRKPSFRLTLIVTALHPKYIAQISVSAKVFAKTSDPLG